MDIYSAVRNYKNMNKNKSKIEIENEINNKDKIHKPKNEINKTQSKTQKIEIPKNIWLSKYYLEKTRDILISIFEQTTNDEFLEITKEALENFSKNKFNTYIESLAYNYAINRFKFEKRKFDILIYYIIFKTYPYFIYFLMFYKTISEQLEIVEKLEKIDSIKNINIGAYSQNLNKYKKYLNEYYLKYNENNVIINFNNFIGINFNKTNVSYSDLPKNYLLINVGFNNTCDNIVYSNYDGIKTNFMTYKDVLDFKIIEKIKTIKNNKCWELYYLNKLINDSSEMSTSINLKNNLGININSKNKSKEELTSMYNIVLCYNNSENLKDCRFTISENEFSLFQLNILVNGGIIYNVIPRTFILYLSKMFYIRHNMLFDVPDNSSQEDTATQKLRAKIAKIIKPCYSKDWKTTAKNIFNEFPEEKYLKYYLEGLKYCCDENDELIFEKYYEHVKIYFFPTNI